MPKKLTVEGIAKNPGRQGAKPRTAPKPRMKRKPRKRPTRAQLIQRARQIVLDRDVDWMSWSQIAEKHGVNEKTVRLNYDEYVNEIAPLIDGEDALEKAREFIRKLEGLQQRFADLAASSKNDSVKLGAMRELVVTLWREIELRQAVGLMPKHLGQLTVVAEVRWVAEQVLLLLKKYDAPPEAMRELHEIMSGDRAN